MNRRDKKFAEFSRLLVSTKKLTQMEFLNIFKTQLKERKDI